MDVSRELPVPAVSGVSTRRNLGVVEVRGEDAATFLAAQFASDITALDEYRGQLSCWCDPKGRVLYLPLIVRHADRYQCLLPRQAVEPFVKRLSMYVLRAAVTIEDKSNELQALGIRFAGNEAQHGLVEAGLDTQFATRSGDGALVLRLETDTRRYLVVTDETGIHKIVDAVALDNIDAYWALFDVAAGLPYLPHELSGEFLPQNLNLDLLGGLSFDKGCFPGQEVIARLRYRGTVKKRLAIVSGEPPADADASPFHPGQPVYAAPDTQQKIGEVLYGYNGPGGCAAIAVADVAYINSHTTAYIENSAGPLQLRPPPYSTYDHVTRDNQ